MVSVNLAFVPSNLLARTFCASFTVYAAISRLGKSLVAHLGCLPRATVVSVRACTTRVHVGSRGYVVYVRRLRSYLR